MNVSEKQNEIQEMAASISAFRSEIISLLEKHQMKLGSALIPIALDTIQTVKIANLIEQMMNSHGREKQ